MCNPEKSLGFGLRSGFELGNLDTEGWCDCACHLPSINLSFRPRLNGVIMSITCDNVSSIGFGTE